MAIKLICAPNHHVHGHSFPSTSKHDGSGFLTVGDVAFQRQISTINQRELTEEEQDLQVKDGVDRSALQLIPNLGQQEQDLLFRPFQDATK